MGQLGAKNIFFARLVTLEVSLILLDVLPQCLFSSLVCDATKTKFISWKAASSFIALERNGAARQTDIVAGR